MNDEYIYIYIYGISSLRVKRCLFYYDNGNFYIIRLKHILVYEFTILSEFYIIFIGPF